MIHPINLPDVGENVAIQTNMLSLKLIAVSRLPYVLNISDYEGLIAEYSEAVHTLEDLTLAQFNDLRDEIALLYPPNKTLVVKRTARPKPKFQYKLPSKEEKGESILDINASRDVIIADSVEGFKIHEVYKYLRQQVGQSSESFTAIMQEVFPRFQYFEIQAGRELGRDFFKNLIRSTRSDPITESAANHLYNVYQSGDFFSLEALLEDIIKSQSDMVRRTLHCKVVPTHFMVPLETKLKKQDFRSVTRINGETDNTGLQEAYESGNYQKLSEYFSRISYGDVINIKASIIPKLGPSPEGTYILPDFQSDFGTDFLRIFELLTEKSDGFQPSPEFLKFCELWMKYIEPSDENALEPYIDQIENQILARELMYQFTGIHEKRIGFTYVKRGPSKDRDAITDKLCDPVSFYSYPFTHLIHDGQINVRVDIYEASNTVADNIYHDLANYYESIFREENTQALTLKERYNHDSLYSLFQPSLKMELGGIHPHEMSRYFTLDLRHSIYLIRIKDKTISIQIDNPEIDGNLDQRALYKVVQEILLGLRKIKYTQMGDIGTQFAPVNFYPITTLLVRQYEKQRIEEFFSEINTRYEIDPDFPQPVQVSMIRGSIDPVAQSHGYDTGRASAKLPRKEERVKKLDETPPWAEYHDIKWILHHIVLDALFEHQLRTEWHHANAEQWWAEHVGYKETQARYGADIRSLFEDVSINVQGMPVSISALILEKYTRSHVVEASQEQSRFISGELGSERFQEKLVHYISVLDMNYGEGVDITSGEKDELMQLNSLLLGHVRTYIQGAKSSDCYQRMQEATRMIEFFEEYQASINEHFTDTDLHIAPGNTIGQLEGANFTTLRLLLEPYTQTGFFRGLKVNQYFHKAVMHRMIQKLTDPVYIEELKPRDDKVSLPHELTENSYKTHFERFQKGAKNFKLARGLDPSLLSEYLGSAADIMSSLGFGRTISQGYNDYMKRLEGS